MRFGVPVPATPCSSRRCGEHVREHLPGQQNRRVVSQALIIVGTAMATGGRLEVLGFAVGDSEDGAFWTGFLVRSGRAASPGLRLVIADAHLGLRGAAQLPVEHGDGDVERVAHGRRELQPPADTSSKKIRTARRRAPASHRSTALSREPGGDGMRHFAEPVRIIVDGRLPAPRNAVLPGTHSTWRCVEGSP